MTTTVELGVQVGFRLDDPVAGVLNNTTYTLGQLAYLDMSDFVYGVSFKRGKNRDLDRFDAGTCSITLNNQERTFDPYNYASVFSGNVLPRRRIRVRTDGVDQWVGSIDDWNFDYSVTGESTASVSATDDFSLLARQELSGVSVPQEVSGARVSRVLNQSTVGWSTTARDIMTGKSVLAAETPTGNALDYLQSVNDSEQGKLFIGKSGDLVFQDRTVTPTTPTVSTLDSTNLQPYWATATNNSHFHATSSYATVSYSTDIGAGSFYVANIYDSNMAPGGFARFTNDGMAVTAGKTYRADFVFSGTSLGFYSGGGAAPSRFRIVPIIEWYNSSGAGIDTTYGTEINPAFGFYWFNVSGVAPVSAVSARMGYQYGGLTDLGFDHYRFDMTYSTASFEDASSPSYSFAGYFDGNTDPTAEYYYQWSGTVGASTSQRYKLVPTTDPIIFSDAGDIPFTSAAVNFGSELLVNQSEVSSAAGTATAVNRNSQLTYGITANSITTLVATTAQLTDIANFIVARYANPEYRFESVTVNLDSLSATNRAKVLALEIGDVCSVKFTPNQLGTGVNQTSAVIGIAHDVKPDRHDVTFSFEALPFTFMVLNDLVYGKLNSVGVLGF